MIKNIINKYFYLCEENALGIKVIHHLYSYAKTSLSILLITIVFIVFTIKDIVPNSLLYTWAIISAVLIFSRIYDTQQYMKYKDDDNCVVWYNKFIYKSLYTAFIWGLSTMLFLIYSENTDTQLILYLMLIGIAGGAVTSIAPDMQLTKLYLVFLLMPVFIYNLIQDDYSHYIVALIFLFTYIFLIYTSKVISKALLKGYEEKELYLEYHNELFLKNNELKSLINNTPVSIFYYDTQLKIINVNKSFLDLFMLKEDEIIGIDMHTLEDKVPVQTLKNALINGKETYIGPYKSMKGLELWIEMKSSAITNNIGEVIGGIGIIENRTKEKKALDDLDYLATHDTLTNLANRRGFMSFMEDLIADEKHKEHYSILFYLDLNRFKYINDTLGHNIGDKLLINVAKRLSTLIAESYNLSRLGGDEFVIVQPYCATHKDNATLQANIYSRKITKLFNTAFMIDNIKIYAKCSIGIVIIEPNSNNIEEIVRHADISMYHSKHKGVSAVAHYSPELDQERKRAFQLQHELHSAIQNSELEPYYQPIVSLDDDTLLAAETLIRWNHPELGLLTPNTFLPLAVESGLIIDIGWYMIDKVCEQISQWKQHKAYQLNYISININVKQLQEVNFTQKIFKVLDTYFLSPSDIRIELTETSLIENYVIAKDAIEKLEDGGIKCNLDDFGTGYSSLAYLRKFSFTSIKIDRTFVLDILNNEEDLYFLKIIVDAIAKMGYDIIIEGVESKEQKNVLKDINDALLYQGYVFSRPLTATNFKDTFC